MYREDDISVSLTVCGGSYGGGSEVLIVYDLSKDNRPFDGKQPSGELLRTRRVQRYVRDGEEQWIIA